MAWSNLAGGAGGALIAVSALFYRQVHRHARARYTHLARVWRRPAALRSPVFSELLVDANSGRTLVAVAENGPRHPASITKLMTLYLLFTPDRDCRRSGSRDA